MSSPTGISTLRKQAAAIVREIKPDWAIEVHTVSTSDGPMVMLLHQPLGTCRRCGAELSMLGWCPKNRDGHFVKPVAVNILLGSDQPKHLAAVIRSAVDELEDRAWELVNHHVQNVTVTLWDQWCWLVERVNEGDASVVAAMRTAPAKPGARLLDRGIWLTLDVGVRAEYGPQHISLALGTEIGSKVDEAIADPSRWPSVLADLRTLLKHTKPEVVPEW